MSKVSFLYSVDYLRTIFIRSLNNEILKIMKIMLPLYEYYYYNLFLTDGKTNDAFPLYFLMNIDAYSTLSLHWQAPTDGFLPTLHIHMNYNYVSSSLNAQIIAEYVLIYALVTHHSGSLTTVATNTLVRLIQAKGGPDTACTLMSVFCSPQINLI